MVGARAVVGVVVASEVVVIVVEVVGVGCVTLSCEM